MHSGYGVEPHLQIIYTIYTFYTAKLYPCVTVTDYLNLKKRRDIMGGKW